MTRVFKKIKSNKGFTMQDVIVAMVVLMLFAGTIGGSYIAVYKIQSQTKISAMATLYGVQIMENIDKISYDEVINGDLRTWRTDYNIPDTMGVNLEVTSYNTEDTIKNVKLTISYTFSGEEKTMVLEKLKVKEV